jgi:hypothetical protein
MPAGKGLLAGLLLAVLIPINGCASTFLVSKDCNTYYFGSTQEKLYNMLCSSGDLEKVLNSADLPPLYRDSLYRFQCVDRSHDGVVRIYTDLSSDQKDRLKDAFKEHGYEINSRPTDNFHVYPLGVNPDFCPTHEKYQGFNREEAGQRGLIA